MRVEQVTLEMESGGGPGPTASSPHLRENVAAASLVLPPDAIAELDTIGR
jgi:aryl-alcohol dehydrogenase-like predicted oxidoreductase